jgi:hypothetical protein
MLFTTYHPLDATIIGLSSEFGCPIIGGTGLEVLLNHYGVVHGRVRSDNDIDFLDLDAKGTGRLMRRLERLGLRRCGGHSGDALLTYAKDGIEVDILMDGGGVASSADVLGGHLVQVGQILVLNECGMLFSKLTRVIDLQNGLASGVDGGSSSAAAKIQHDLGDVALLKQLMARRKSYAEYRALVEEFAPPSLMADGDCDENKPSPYFTLLQ